MTHEPFEVRLALVLLAECLFVALVIAATGSPPSFVTTVVFASALAVLLEAQAHQAGVASP
jgi:Sec-independent protein secretion pathway component TatC